ncbi:type IV secretion system protein, partial [Escherichia coli]
AFVAIAIVESMIVINAAVLFMGFGGSQYTREYALAMPRYAVSVGAKLFVLTLIVGLISKAGLEWKAAYDHSQTSMWTIVGLSLLCAILAKTVPDIIQGLINGTSMGGGGAIGSTAGQAVAGLAAVATAGIAAAAALSKVAESIGGGENGGGLAKSINDSLGGGNGGPSGGPMGTGGGPAGPSGGGSGRSDPAAAMAGLRFAESPRVALPSQSASGSSSSNGSGSAPKSSAQIAAEQVKAGNPGAQKDGSSGAADAVHKLADVAVRGVGIATAIAMPGAENAASASLSPPPRVGQVDKQDDMSIESAGEENIIRPAPVSDDSQTSAQATSAQNSGLSSLHVPGLAGNKEK